MSNDDIGKMKLNNNEVDKKKNVWEKKTSIQKRKLIDTPLQNISHQKVYASWQLIVNDGVLSTSSQIVEQIEVFLISKMNDSVPVKKPKEQTQFSPKKSLVKGKWF